MGLVFQAIVARAARSSTRPAPPRGSRGRSSATALVLTISAWIFAGRDIKTLRARGYDPPSIWWMLVPLSPLAYFIARGKVVRAEGKRAWPPELLFFLSIMASRSSVAVIGVDLRGRR